MSPHLITQVDQEVLGGFQRGNHGIGVLDALVQHEALPRVLQAGQEGEERVEVALAGEEAR